MKVEIRTFDQGEERTPKYRLILIATSKAESELIDTALRNGPFNVDGVGPAFKGNVCLSDGYSTHYLSLEAV